ncbi:uncharacterized protein [Diadema setosum]|uniref:uncharacterized protein n=1 Tax=Diadema setosum TaxID=31175 RepID=UPI003B3A0708
MATPLLASNGLQIATSPSTVLPTSFEPAFVSPDAVLSHAPDHGPFPQQDVSHHDHQTFGSSSELQQYEAQSTSYDVHVPSTVQEALSMVQDCEDVDSLGQLLFEWCILDVPFRRDWDVVGRMDGKLKRSRPQSAQDFCRFACGFHAASQRAHFTTPFEDQSTIIYLGLAAFSRCRDCHDTSEMKLDEDAYCILQMILHLKLPLTEVLASSPGLLPWLPGKPDGLLLRGVLTVLVDFDPITAFSILQGIGWTHLCWEEPGIREVFGQQLSSLVEVLLDCGNYQHCRTALTHLLNLDDERQSCCQLYNSLLSKVLDTCGRCPSAMAIFEDMMDAGLVVNTPTLSKLLTLMWKSPDEEGYEDALCVYHYGLGLGVYPVHTRRGTVWEATVFLGASDAEIFFTLRTLLDQLLDWLVAECGTGGPGPTDDGGAVENGVLEERVTDRHSKGHTLEGMMPASGPLDRQLSCHEGIVQSVNIYINLREAPDAVRDCLLSEDEMSIDVFARMLSTKKAIQNSLKENFQPLTVRLHTNGSSDGSSNYAYTLAFNREPLSCWLLDLLD